ncbi:hypothetical protein GCM10009429_25010 [Dyella marensis]
MIRFAHPFGAALRAFFALRARPAYAGMTRIGGCGELSPPAPLHEEERDTYSALARRKKAAAGPNPQGADTRAPSTRPRKASCNNTVTRNPSGFSRTCASPP